MLAIRKLMQVAGDPVVQPVCPSCGRMLRLSRITPGTHSRRVAYGHQRFAGHLSDEDQELVGSRVCRINQSGALQV